MSRAEKKANFYFHIPFKKISFAFISHLRFMKAQPVASYNWGRVVEVRRKNCGAKTFVVAKAHRRLEGPQGAGNWLLKVRAKGFLEGYAQTTRCFARESAKSSGKRWPRLPCLKGLTLQRPIFEVRLPCSEGMGGMHGDR